MEIYIYKEADNTGLVVIKSASKPANNATIESVNGQAIPANRQAFVLLDEVSQINACFNTSNKDYKTVRDAMKSCVSDLGGGSVETGFDMLSSEEKAIAAANRIGTGVQIAQALPNLAIRDQASTDYIAKLKGCLGSVRSMRSMALESKVWSRCAQFSIEVSLGVFAPMPEVMYSNITINNPLVGELGGNLLGYYETAGILGYAGSDKLLGILDYLMSTAGTRFEAAGFLQIFDGITPDGYASLADFRDDLVNILTLGSLDTIST